MRQAGGRTLCLPWLRWLHRFSRPGGVPYPLFIEDKLRNYIIGHSELGLPLEPIIAHFEESLPEETVTQVVGETLRGGGRRQGLRRHSPRSPPSGASPLVMGHANR